MGLFNKKTVVLLAAVVTVFLLASSQVQGKYQFAFVEEFVASALAPIQSIFSSVGFNFRKVGLYTSDLMTAYSDNQVLRTENEEIRQNNLNIAEVMAENMRLRSMLDYKTEVKQFDLITAAVVGRDLGALNSTIIINRGSADGITKDMPVVTPQGLVGSVVNVYNHAAKVQLILDSRSAVGALVQRPESRVVSIVEGSSSAPLTPRMVNVARDADIIKSDKLITSGFGGIYPKGLFIGEVIDVVNEEGGLLKYASIKTSVDFGRLEEVLVIVRSREPVPTLSVPPLPPASSGKEASKGAER